MQEKRALICEDDAAIRMLVRTVVQREGFDVDMAENGREGMQKLQDGCYHLLVLDLMMPEVDGYAVVQYLKEKRNAALKRVIVMTAATEALRKDFPEPICTLLPKPFNIDALTAAVRNCARDCRESS
jgi:two-component system, OmpR family, response regulator ResD